MSTTITYKGNTIATAENETKTLETAGKYLEANVLVTDVTTPAYVNPWLYPYNYGSEDASNYFFTGKKNLQQTEPFTSLDGQATIVFPKALMGDAQPEDVTAGKIFTSASGIQSVGTRQEGPQMEIFQFDVSDGGWTGYAVDTEVTYQEVASAWQNGKIPVAMATYGDGTYYAILSMIDTQHTTIRFYFDLAYFTIETLNGVTWSCG